MLRLLFQSLEEILGPSISEVSHFVYWGGLVLLGAVLLLPLWRSWLDYATARAGLMQRWVATCPTCGQVGAMRGATCSLCGKTLAVPWPVRLRTRGARWLEKPVVQRFGWAYHLLGVAVFILIVLVVMLGADALSPAGELERLFLGVAVLALAAAGRSAGRALRLERRGLVARAGDGLQTLAAVGVLAVALFLAGSARPASETPLGSFTVLEGTARIGELQVPTAEGEVGIEYLQVDHQALGYTRIVPLAFLGAERVPLSAGPVRRWIVDHLREHADAYAARGLTVRLRTDWRRVVAGATYEVVQAGGQLLIRRAEAETSAP